MRDQQAVGGGRLGAMQFAGGRTGADDRNANSLLPDDFAKSPGFLLLRPRAEMR